MSASPHVMIPKPDELDLEFYLAVVKAGVLCLQQCIFKGEAIVKDLGKNEICRAIYNGLNRMQQVVVIIFFQVPQYWDGSA